MNKKCFKVLEFDKIISLLEKKAITSMGKDKVNLLEPTNSIEEIVLKQKETTESSQMIVKKGPIPLIGAKNILPYVKRASLEGVLSIKELIHIGDFIKACNKTVKYYKNGDSKEKYPILENFFDSIEILINLEKEIKNTILNEEEICDDATSELSEIRKNIKSTKTRIKEQLNNILHSQTYKNMLQDFVITIRQDRFCVPVKQEYKNTFSGIIHDQSSTGSTIFMEPMVIVSLNNKIKELKKEEEIEIEKILKKLSEEVNKNKNKLLSNLEIIGKLDLIFAKGELSLSLDCNEAHFNENGYIDIKKGRHPLLSKEKVVPSDIYLGKDFDMLLITGPNTGGKTVSLKTIGLLTLMGQAGLHIPASFNSKLSVFDDIFVDIGDEQSIEQNLSTFSSHMKNIIDILKNINNNSLILLDELGSGTDPVEGAALAISILQYLREKKVKTVVTTHYSELKVYALNTDRIENASCEFDIETLKPTYKLLIGIPGKSNAFAISKKLGLDESIIKKAKEALNKDNIKFEDVITDLEISKKIIDIEKEKIKEYRKEAEDLKIKFQKEKEKLDKQKEKILLKAKEESEYILKQAKKEADTLIKEINKRAQNLNIQQLQEVRDKLKENLDKVSKDIEKNYNKNSKKNITKEIKRGDKVFINKFNQSGIVISDIDTNKEVMVKMGIMKIKISLKELTLDEEEETIKLNEKNYSSNNIRREKNKSLSTEIDIRGLNVEEAIENLDKYIDDAYLMALKQITVIHGKGTGVLRKAVQDYLKKHKEVKNYRKGEFGEGEDGVTIVTLK